jgi:hypothetical protein
MPHDAKLDGEAQFIMRAATHLTFQPVNWIESVVPEQTYGRCKIDRNRVGILIQGTNRCSCFVRP